MKKPAFSRKELKSLANRLTSLLEKGLDNRSVEVRRLIQQIKFLLNRVGFRRRQLRRIFGTAAVVLGIGFSQNVNAQITFAAPVTNPFGLPILNYNIDAPIIADLDNDGDFDILVKEYDGKFKYYQNTGTNTAPAFAAPVTNPFGLFQSASYASRPSLTVADLDNDGDLDLMAHEYHYGYQSADIEYFQNTGTPTAPVFATPTINPFGISPTDFFKGPALVDLDNDGDFDLLTIQDIPNSSTFTVEFKYQENIGTTISPNFGAPQANPFGLMQLGPSTGFVDFGDLDSDGDLDLLLGEYGGNNANFQYYENSGSALLPVFSSPVQNPFGLVGVSTGTSSAKLNNPVLLDMDGDGDLDILTTDFGAGFVYFENISIPLPVRYSKLNGHLQNEDAIINWTTSSEINSAYFSIERSLNGISFQSIGKVGGKETTNNTNEYYFVDKGAQHLESNKLFYRLRQFDIDNSNSLSSVIELGKGTTYEINYAIHPNPSQGKLKLNSLENIKEISVYNNLGQIALQENIKPTTQLTFDLSDESNGIYHVVLIDKTNRKRFLKFVLQQ